MRNEIIVEIVNLARINVVLYLVNITVKPNSHPVKVLNFFVNSFASFSSGQI